MDSWGFYITHGLSIINRCDSFTEQYGVAQKNHSYVSQSAVALRCRVMPPPCMKNPHLMDDSGVDIDPFGSSRSKCEGLFPSAVGGDGISSATRMTAPARMTRMVVNLPVMMVITRCSSLYLTKTLICELVIGFS